MQQGTYSIKSLDGRTHIWHQPRLIELAKDLPVKMVLIKSIREFDQTMWFYGPRNVQPTCREVAVHARRIFQASLEYPIILSASGRLMDGMHRVAKAYIKGMTEIKAVQFESDPDPDEIV